jgi:transcription elongation factor Elf1
MLNDASAKFRWNYSERSLNNLRHTRNKFVHRGFIPSDNQRSIELLFEIAIPMLLKCFRDIYAFDLIKNLDPLSSNHVDLALRAYRALRAAKADHKHCADALIRLLELTFVDAFLSGTTVHAMGSQGFQWTSFEVTEERKRTFIHRHGLSWDRPHFNCPVCESTESILCELDADDLEQGKFQPVRLQCTHCDFSVGRFSEELEGYEPVLCSILLEQQLRDLRKEDVIEWLEGFGKDFAHAVMLLRKN